MGATRPASVIVQVLFSGFCVFSFYFLDARRVAPIRGSACWWHFVLEETQALMGAFLTNIVTIPTKIMPNSKISIVATILVLEKQLYLQQKFI